MLLISHRQVQRQQGHQKPCYLQSTCHINTRVTFHLRTQQFASVLFLLFFIVIWCISNFTHSASSMT